MLYLPKNNIHIYQKSKVKEYKNDLYYEKFC